MPDQVEERLKVADEAFAKYDYPGALRGYKAALTAVEHLTDTYQKRKLHAEILLKIVDALDLGGKWLDALMYVETVVNEARRTKNAKAEMEAELRAGKILMKRSKWKEAMQRYGRLMAMLPKGGSPVMLAECNYGLASANWRLGDMEKASAHAKKALDLTAKEPSPTIRGQALTLLASIADTQGNTPLAIERFNEAISTLEGAGNRIELARAYNNLGEVHKRNKDYPSATKQYDKCVEVARASNNRRTEAYGLMNAAESLAREGRTMEAEERIAGSEAILATMDEPFALANTYYIRGMIAAGKGEPEAMHVQFKSAVQALERLEVPFDLGVVCLEYGKALANLGMVDDARKMYQKAESNLFKTGSKSYLEEVKALLAALG